jgi:hypothetical protein
LGNSQRVNVSFCACRHQVLDGCSSLRKSKDHRADTRPGPILQTPRPQDRLPSTHIDSLRIPQHPPFDPFDRCAIPVPLYGEIAFVPCPFDRCRFVHPKFLRDSGKQHLVPVGSFGRSSPLDGHGGVTVSTPRSASLNMLSSSAGMSSSTSSSRLGGGVYAFSGGTRCAATPSRDDEVEDDIPADDESMLSDFPVVLHAGQAARIARRLPNLLNSL